MKDKTLLKVDIAVLNYNGKDLLKKYLPSIVKASANSRFLSRVTVLDNCSTDGSLDFLKSEFPQVDIYSAQENKVYCSYNEFFRRTDSDIVVILNSDIEVDINFLDPLLEKFEMDSNIFFVSSKMYFFDGITYQGDNSRMVQRFGIICADTRFNGYEKLIENNGYTFSTGNGAFDRKKFLKLGGFDDIYLPGRYEDVDLCFRAWKAGYKGIYEPKSIIYHEGYASFKSAFSQKEIQAMVFRNSIFFMWKNITDFWLLSKFNFWLLPRLVFFVLTKRFYLIKAFWQALIYSSKAKDRKRKVCALFKLTDKEVIRLVG